MPNTPYNIVEHTQEEPEDTAITEVTIELPDGTFVDDVIVGAETFQDIAETVERVYGEDYELID